MISSGYKKYQYKLEIFGDTKASTLLQEDKLLFVPEASSQNTAPKTNHSCEGR
jgi:hypothetical protein